MGIVVLGGPLLGGALLGCGSGPSALATRAHEDARTAERMVETRPGVAARRFADAGDHIDALAKQHPGHPLTEELHDGAEVGGVPRAVFESRLAIARRVMGRADLLDAAVYVLPPPPKGLGRLGRARGPRAVDALGAALIRAKRAVPQSVQAHGPPPDATPPAPMALPAPIPSDPRALEAQWQAVRGQPDADAWLAAVMPRLEVSQRFVWARALHRGLGWQALAELLLAEGDRDGAERALGFAVDRGVLEGLSAPLRPDGWLPVHLDRTLRTAGWQTRADRLLALYAAGLSRTFALPDNGIADLEAKAHALADRAVEVADPVAAGWLSPVLRRDVLDAVRRRARRPGADPLVIAAHRRVHALDAAERAEPALATVRAMAPALAAAAAAHGGSASAPNAAAGDTLGPSDRIVFHLAMARVASADGDRHLGAALDAAAALDSPDDRIYALLDADAVQAALELEPGPHTRAGLARLLFAVDRR